MSSPSPPTQRRALERRAEILEAARQRMFEGGMRSVTHRAVAERAGVPIGSIRYYFATRERLLLACLEEQERDRTEAVGRAGELASTALELREVGALVVRAIWGAAASDRDLVGIVAATMDGVRESQELSGRLAAWRPLLDRDLHLLLRACGIGDVDAELVTAVANGSIVNSAVEGRGGVEQRAAEAVAALLAGATRTP